VLQIDRTDQRRRPKFRSQSDFIDLAIDQQTIDARAMHKSLLQLFGRACSLQSH
jgi:hypothetical protein